jgi:CMP-N,N'-diacetyllegionaminic acid synthase
VSDNARLLAVIPARGGSKGLPGKNIRLFLGLPLIAHTIMFARLCPEIDRCIVSTDSPEIAAIAKEFGADVPFIRPPELAEDDTPMWPVLQHSLTQVEQQTEINYGLLLLLDPTSPVREPSDVTGAMQQLGETPDADGIVGVSQPHFNPIWNCVVEREGWMRDLIEGGREFDRRQQVSPVYRINGSLYIWRTEFVRRQKELWRMSDKHLIYEIPEARASSIDTLEEFQQAELLVQSGFLSFPWLDQTQV